MKIGAVLMLVELDALKRALTFPEIRDSALLCEESGLDSVWVYDHLIYRMGKKKSIGIWEGWSMLSALAASTRKVKLGTLVACSSFRNPALLAKMAHTVDEISAGRLILGLGAGWNEAEYDAFGLPFDHRVDRLEEALHIIQPLLKTGYVDFAGKYYSARDCLIAPHSPRPEGPPLLIGGRKPRLMRLAARYADMYNACYLTIPRSSTGPLKALAKACTETGRDPASIQKTFLISQAHPDLLGWQEPTRRGCLTGSVEEVAQTMLDYDELGCDHLMFHINPSTPEAYRRLAKSASLYREMKEHA